MPGIAVGDFVLNSREMSIDFSLREAWELHGFLDHFERWLSEWLFWPVQNSLGGIEPPELSSFRQRIYAIRSKLRPETTNRPEVVTIFNEDLPIITRAILFERRRIAEEQEALRQKTSRADLHKSIDSKMDVVSKFLTCEWFRAIPPCRIPRVTEYLTIRAAQFAVPKHEAPAQEYDEKFGILESPTNFFPFLAHARAQAWIRGCDVCVAYVDIDDFKSFNTKYTETFVDRVILPDVMQAIENHVFSKGTAFRFGGDEYALQFPNYSVPEAVMSLQAMMRRVHSLTFPRVSEHITLSVGINCIAGDSFLTNLEVLEWANKAKDVAKKKGGKRCIALALDSNGEPDISVVAHLADG